MEDLHFVDLNPNALDFVFFKSSSGTTVSACTYPLLRHTSIVSYKQEARTQVRSGANQVIQTLYRANRTCSHAGAVQTLISRPGFDAMKEKKERKVYASQKAACIKERLWSAAASETLMLARVQTGSHVCANRDQHHCLDLGYGQICSYTPVFYKTTPDRKQPPACTPASISLVCMKRLCQTRYALEHNQPHKNTPAAVFCEHGETWPSNAPCVVLHSCELCLAHHTAFKVKQISQLATQYTAYDAKKISYLTAQHTANSSEGLVSGYGTSYCIQQLILISRVVHHTANYEQTISSFHALHVTRKTDCASFCMQHEEPVSGDCQVWVT
eukprot:1157556-Pelagomonas_calceolata.AAC.6